MSTAIEIAHIEEPRQMTALEHAMTLVSALGVLECVKYELVGVGDL